MKAKQSPPPWPVTTCSIKGGTEGRSPVDYCRPPGRRLVLILLLETKS